MVKRYYLAVSKHADVNKWRCDGRIDVLFYTAVLAKLQNHIPCSHQIFCHGLDCLPSRVELYENFSRTATESVSVPPCLNPFALVHETAISSVLRTYSISLLAKAA